jgi:hypothetical protein
VEGAGEEPVGEGGGAQLQATKALDAAKLEAVDELKAKRVMDDANANIRLVEAGAWVHNVNYSTALLNVAITNCQEVI